MIFNFITNTKWYTKKTETKEEAMKLLEMWLCDFLIEKDFSLSYSETTQKLNECMEELEAETETEVFGRCFTLFAREE